MYEDEKNFINSFIDRKKKLRYNNLLVNEKKRRIFLDTLSHGLALKLAFSLPVPTCNCLVDQLERELISKGSPSTCFIFADSSEYDGCTVTLKIAISHLGAAHN